MADDSGSGNGDGRTSRWTSRRFLLALAGFLVSILVMMGKLAPEQTDTAVQVIVGAAALVLSVLGYQVTEAGVDKARAANGNSREGSTK